MHTIITFLKENPLYRFLFFAGTLLIGWFLIYELWLHPMGTLDKIVIENLSSISTSLLEIMGYDAIQKATIESDIRVIGIDGTNGLWVGDPCNGITLFALFTGFVLAFPGPIKRKLWFIPFGLVTIHILNIIRITSLCLIVLHAPDSLEFNHTYTFTIVVYSYVFLLWYWWANKLSKVE